MFGLIANPKAGNGKAISVLSRFENLLIKFKVQHVLAFVEEGINKVLSEFEENNIKHLIVFGGDGTVNSVGRSILNKDMAMIVIPAGSGNDFSRSNWKDMDFIKIVKAIKENKIRYEFVDVGYVKELDIYFFNSFGIGLSGSVAFNVKKLLNYKLATIKSLFFNYKVFNLKVIDIYDGKSISFHIGINKIEGHGIMTFPKAKNEDGLIDIVIIKDVPYLFTPFKLVKLLKGEHINDKYVVYKQVNSLTFEINKQVYGHYDGEVFKIESGCYNVVTINRALKIIKWD